MRKNDVIRFFGIELALHLRRCEEGRDHFEDISVAPRSVVESGRVNQDDTTPVQIESTRKLDGVCVRSQASADAEVGSTNEIDKLYKS